MTPAQQNALALIVKLNNEEFDGQFLPSEIMAFCDVESSFSAHAYHRDNATHWSCGIMQVENTTGPQFGCADVSKCYDLEFGLRLGMKVAEWSWDQLAKHFGRDPSYEEWAASYNEGVVNVERGRDHDAYVNKWLRAQEFWAAQPNVDD